MKQSTNTYSRPADFRLSKVKDLCGEVDDGLINTLKRIDDSEYDDVFIELLRRDLKELVYNIVYAGKSEQDDVIGNNYASVEMTVDGEFQDVLERMRTVIDQFIMVKKKFRDVYNRERVIAGEEYDKLCGESRKNKDAGIELSIRHMRENRDASEDSNKNPIMHHLKRLFLRPEIDTATQVSNSNTSSFMA